MKRLFAQVDKTIFLLSITVFTLIFLFILLVPASGAMVTALLNFTLGTVGWVYIIAFAVIFITFIGIALSRYGRLKLGRDDDKPEYSFFSWMGMLIGAGLGCGLVFFGVSEPVSHFLAAPFAESGAALAAADAMRITFLHWSFLPWACYGMVGLCIGYFTYRKGLPGMISSSFRPLLGDRTQRAPGKIIDAFSVIAIICGISMSVGFAATQLSSGLNTVYGIKTSFLLVAFIILIIGILGTASALGGIAKGIKIVGDINFWLIILMIVFTLLCGPTMDLVKFFFQSMGDLVFNLPWIMLFTDSYQTVSSRVGFDWVGGWTAFYWAWWVAFAPFVGGFLAKISRGRTIREFVFASILVPGILCCIWFTAFGGQAIYMSLFEGSAVAAAAAEDSTASLFIFLQNLPVSAVTIPVVIALIITLIVTSVNSATYEAGAMSMGGNAVPSLALRAFWGAFIVLFAVLFFSINGLDTLKNTAVVFAFPFIIITLLMIVNLILDLRKSEGGNHERHVQGY
jgi:glycine betaine transporter